MITRGTVLSEEDEGVAEALRRDAEANVNPDVLLQRQSRLFLS